MVFIGIDDPSSWPDYFGKFKDAYTLRSFWGYVFTRPTGIAVVADQRVPTSRCTWHQSLRRVCDGC